MYRYIGNTHIFGPKYRNYGLNKPLSMDGQTVLVKPVFSLTTLLQGRGEGR